MVLLRLPGDGGHHDRRGQSSVDFEHGVRFHEATALEAAHQEGLARTVDLRVLRWFPRRGLLAPATAADMRTWQDAGGLTRLRLASRVDGISLSDTRSATRVLSGPLRPDREPGPRGAEAARSVTGVLSSATNRGPNVRCAGPPIARSDPTWRFERSGIPESPSATGSPCGFLRSSWTALTSARVDQDRGPFGRPNSRRGELDGGESGLAQVAS